MNSIPFTKVVFFDFTGTLFDPFVNIRTILNTVAKKRGYKYFNEPELERVEKMTPIQLLDAFLVPASDRKEVVKEVLSSLEGEIHSIPPVQGMQDVINILHKQGNYLGILSSNSKENIVKWLKSYDLDVFHDIICIPFQEEKTSHLQSIKSRFSGKTDSFIFVSDESKDLLQALKAGFTTIAVTWGFDNFASLQETNPASIFSKTEDFMEFASTKSENGK